MAAMLTDVRRLFLAMFGAALLIPAAALGSDSHDKLDLSPAQEAKLLDQLIEASPHRQALEHAKKVHGDLPPGDLGKSDPLQWGHIPPLLKAWPKKKGPRNYGFLPFWTIKGTKIHWDRLTELAWFSAELDGTGKVKTTHGWGGSTAKSLIKTAHSNGVQVTLTFTLFSKTGISNVIATAAKRKTLVDKIVSLVLAGGGDGVNIDFEGLPKASRDQMKAFTVLLTKTMHTKLPGSDVTLATPPVDWTGAWDYDYLADNCDGLFVMAYGVHYSGSNPGPQLPMANNKPWVHKTLQWVVDDYVKWGKPHNKLKFLIGLPLYGNTWASSSSKPGAKKLGKGKAVTYEKAQVEAKKHGGFKWDSASKSSYYVYKISGGYQQTWVDNPQAFEMRAKYLGQRGVNMGLWALGYADKNPEVWSDIAAFIGKPGTPGGTDAGSSGGQDGGSTGADAGSLAPDSGSIAQDTGSTTSPDAGTNSDDAGATADSGNTADSGHAGAPDAGTTSDVVATADTGTTHTADAGSTGPLDAGAHTSTDVGSPVGEDAGTASTTDTTTTSGDTLFDPGLDATATDSGAATLLGGGKTGASSGCQVGVPLGGAVPFSTMFVFSLLALTLVRRNND